MSNKLSRRDYFKKTALTLGTIPFTAWFAQNVAFAKEEAKDGKKKGSEKKQGKPKWADETPPSSAMTSGLKYVKKAKSREDEKKKDKDAKGSKRQGATAKPGKDGKPVEPIDQFCYNCALYQNPQVNKATGEEYGACTIFANNHVPADAWCLSWAAGDDKRINKDKAKKKKS